VRIIFLLICLNRLSISLVAMDHFYKSYTETDLAMLHYVTFTEPIAISPMKTLSFDSNEFMSNSMKKVIEGNINDPFILLEEQFFDAVLLYQKNMKWNWKNCRMKILSSSWNHKVSATSFMYTKVYRIKYIAITFVLQTYNHSYKKCIHSTTSRGVID
jgi:hypothetical protein